MKTLDQIRDEVAGMLPGDWIVSPDGIWSKREWGDGHVRSIRAGCLPPHDHPCPTTLDGIAAMMPEGWVTQIHIATGLNGGKSLCQAVAFEVKPSPKQIGGDKGITTELEARTRLLHAVLTATKGATHE